MSDDEPSPDSDDDGDWRSEPGPVADSDERPAPLADLAADVHARRKQGGDDLIEEAFAEQPFDSVGGQSVWDAGDEDRGSEFGVIGEVIEAGDRTYVVSKQNFCERCQFFSEPPEVHCTHKGTEIREFVDTDNVRVYSCPIVEERGLEGVRQNQ